MKDFGAVAVSKIKTEEQTQLDLGGFGENRIAVRSHKIIRCWLIGRGIFKETG